MTEAAYPDLARHARQAHQAAQEPALVSIFSRGTGYQGASLDVELTRVLGPALLVSLQREGRAVPCTCEVKGTRTYLLRLDTLAFALIAGGGVALVPPERSAAPLARIESLADLGCALYEGEYEWK